MVSCRLDSAKHIAKKMQPSSRAFNAVQRFVEERMATAPPTASLLSVTLNMMTRTYWFVNMVYSAIGRTEDAIDVALEGLRE